MPKIGITGHTSGVGKHLFDQMGHKGWSLSTGTDLSTDEGIDKMIADASDVDVLINNAAQPMTHLQPASSPQRQCC